MDSGLPSPTLRRTRAKATAVVLCAFISAACARDVRRPRKTDLARLPAKIAEMATSDDGASYAYVEIPRKTEARVVHDGHPGEMFPFIVGLTFLPEARRPFYWAGEATGYLVADGKKIGGDFIHEGALVGSAGGRRWATTCTAATARPAVVLVDGTEMGRYANASNPALSHDGRHVAYLASADGGGTSLVIDGREHAKYAAPAMACAARAKELRERDPRQGAGFWPQFQVKYLSDGTLLTMTQDEDGWGIYRDDKRLGSYEASLVQRNPKMSEECPASTAVAAWSLTVADKAPVAAWWERLPGREEQWRVVANGKPVDGVVCSAPYLNQPPELTADGSRVAYVCPLGGAEPTFTVVAGGHRYGPYIEVWAYVWADDGSHVAYGAAEKPDPQPLRYFVDGEPQTDYFAAVWRPRFDPATGRLAWEAEVQRGGHRVLGIGRRAISSFDDVIWGPAFVRTGVASWIIRRGRRLVRLDVPTR